jgi:excinuclease ABC subunit B
MRVAMEETGRRREIQRAHNEEHGITPASISKGVSDIVEFLGLTSGGRRRGKKVEAVPEGATPDEIRRVMVEVEQEMMVAAEELRFERAGELRDRLAVQVGIPLPTLSMGMSGDYEVAVEEGATLVRVGSAIFGGR